MSDEIKKPEEITDAPVLSDTDLEQVAGGKASFHDLSFTHNIDKSSPVLQTELTTPDQPTTPPAK
jgi:type VI protein secretion system component Hcp